MSAAVPQPPSPRPPSPRPPSPPRPRPPSNLLGDATVRLICAIVGFGALVAVLLTVAVTSDSGAALGLSATDSAGPSSGASSSPGAGLPPGRSQPASSTSLTSPGPTSPGPTSSTPAAGASAGAGQISAAYIIAHFPFPQGSTVATGPPVPDVKYRKVAASLPEVHSFYLTHLVPLTGTWEHPHAAVSGGRPARWTGTVTYQAQPAFTSYLTIRATSAHSTFIEVNFRG